MKKTAVVLLALLGGGSTLLTTGCWYDRPNPWDTTADVEDYQDKKEQDWLLELKKPYDLPQNDGVVFALPDLQAWQDTVLRNADLAVLSRMRDQSVQKTAALEARAMSMAPIHEDNKVQIYDLIWQVKVEKLRLRMIDQEISASR